MIPKECKRLAEVDFPIAVVSKHSAREKSIRHGHPSTLHLWWARRPLAACRSMLMALLLPDPCDEHCPADFKEKARALLPDLVGNVGPEDIDLRRALLKFIGDFANWDHSNHPKYLEVSRGLVKAAHPEETPLVVDPFAGGGSIPLEALRIGCDTFASDLNPVACLILKVMLEDIPRHGPKLAEELRCVGAKIRNKVEKELAEFYPRDANGATPIAYLWARTVRCESPNCGAEIPLIKTLWLCDKPGRKRALRYEIFRTKSEPPRVQFEIFEPKSDSEVLKGTVARAKASCLCCGAVLPPERVRSQLATHRGGSDVIFDDKGNRVDGARLLAVVLLSSGSSQRQYRLPTASDGQAVWKAHQRFGELSDRWSTLENGQLSPAPNEPLTRVPVPFGVINVWVYGMNSWGDLYSTRQKLCHAIVCEGIAENIESCSSPVVLPLILCKLLRHCNVLAKWHRGSETVAGTLGLNALPMSWDFPEMHPFAPYAGGFDDSFSDVFEPCEALYRGISRLGHTEQGSALKSPLPDESVAVWFTDPPYYDNLPYSYLSDYFYVWIRRAFGRSLPATLASQLSPKEEEAVAYVPDGGSADDAKHAFETKMRTAFGEGKRIATANGIGSVVFAHKSTEGWEALLTGITEAGWIVVSSWPIATERGARLRAQAAAALATSVHLVCRPRPDDSEIGDWREVLKELPHRVAAWMERLQTEGIRGADLVFACIGPALEIFSRYSRVETADGREVKLAEYLEKVWEVVGRTALEQVLGTDEAKARNGAAGALEEDARLTALFLWTLQSTSGKNGDSSEEESEDDGEDDSSTSLTTGDEGATKSQPKGFSLIFDVVRRFAIPLGIELPKWEDRIIKTEKGVVRLLPVTERAKQLFGEDGARAVADWIVNDPVKNLQTVLFPEAEVASVPKVRGRRRRSPLGDGRKIDLDPSALDTGNRNEATTLDRVHAAMLLQAGGQTNALRALLKAEADRGPDFLRLANALSALYPTGSEEKRLIDAMLLAVPR